LVLTAVFATGCPNEPSKNFKDAPTVQSINAALNDYLADLQHTCECYAIKEKWDASTKKCTEGTTPAMPDGPNKAMILRNQALDRVMGMADDNYQGFINAIETRRSRTEFIADIIELGTGATLGSIKGKQRTVQILGIALTAFRGIRKSEDLNFYKQQTTPILISKMDDNRSKVEQRIVQKKDRPIDKYSMPEAIRDMVAYYNAGTLVRAFTELAKDTAVQAQASENGVLRLKDINPADIVTLTPDVSAASVQIGALLKLLDKQLTGGTDSQKADAKEKLRLIYLDIAKGDKADQFKPILEKVRTNNPSLAAAMKKLEGTDEESKSVEGLTTEDTIQEIFRGTDMQKQGNLIVALRDIFTKRV